MIDLALENKLKELEKEYQYSDTFYLTLKEFAETKIHTKEENPLDNKVESLIDTINDIIWDCFNSLPRLLYLEANLEGFLDLLKEYIEIAQED
jgi:hypothetical protein